MPSWISAMVDQRVKVALFSRSSNSRPKPEATLAPLAGSKHTLRAGMNEEDGFSRLIGLHVSVSPHRYSKELKTLAFQKWEYSGGLHGERNYRRGDSAFKKDRKGFNERRRQRPAFKIGGIPGIGDPVASHDKPKLGTETAPGFWTGRLQLRRERSYGWEVQTLRNGCRPRANGCRRECHKSWPTSV